MPLFSFLQKSAKRPAASAIASAPAPTPTPGAAAHPAVDCGIVAWGVDKLLCAHDDLLARIKLCYGADRETFEADLLRPVRHYAAFVNALPATSDNFFCEVGGLFRLGLEVAFFALQGTDGHIVSGRATISTRRQLEPRWRHATFLAGLCCELHRTLGHLVVTDESGSEWPAYLGPLTTWLAQRRSKRFFLRWAAAAQESRALGLFALPHVIPAQTMQQLATGNTIAVPQMLACLAGMPLYREQNILGDLVKRASALVIDRDLIASASRHGRPILGIHVERYLIDAMRQLVRSHAAWTPNQERSRVWYGSDGLFIVWPNAVAELRKLLEDDELPGIPKAPEAILEILLSTGAVVPHSTGRKLWLIAPPPGRAAIEAVKVASPEILLPAGCGFAPPIAAVLAMRSPAPDRASDPPPAQGDLPRPAANPRADGAEDAEIVPAGGPVPSIDHDNPPGGVENIATAAPTRPTTFKLLAPLRLNPAVRDALARVIDSLNGDARAAMAIMVPTGVFVPLDHFKQAQLGLPVVLRALAETSMAIAGAEGAVATVEHEVCGQQKLGFILKPGYVQGLDPLALARLP